MGLVFQIESAALTDIGRKRKKNEDYVSFFEPESWEEVQTSGRVYLVADGVGGAARGERASQYAAQKVLFDYFQHPELDPGQRLKRSMRLAGNEIHSYAERSGRFSHMATTMVAAVVLDDRLTVANVGDSRAYLIRNGQLRQITRDHTIAEELIRGGVYSEEEAMSSKSKNRITRSLGGEANVRVDIFDDITLQPGDRILLCSDGLTRYASQQDLILMTQEGTAHEVVEALVDFANRRGGADNISAILVSVGQPVGAEVFESLAPRGQTPTEVDWDTMITVADTPQLAGRAQVGLPQEYIPWLVLGAALFIAFGVLGFWVGSGPRQEAAVVEATPTLGSPAPAATATPDAASSLVTQAATGPLTPALIATETPGVTGTTVPGATSPAAVVAVPPPQEVCVIEAESDPGLGWIFELFGQTVEDNKEYFVCQIKEVNGVEVCQLVAMDKLFNATTQKEEPNFHPGDWIVIPNINQDLCKREGRALKWVRTEG